MPLSKQLTENTESQPHSTNNKTIVMGKNRQTEVKVKAKSKGQGNTTDDGDDTYTLYIGLHFR